MHFEAAHLNNSAKDLAAMLTKYDSDLSYLENRIEAARSEGRDTAAMVLQLEKGNQRYECIMTFYEAATAMIKAQEQAAKGSADLIYREREVRRKVAIMERWSGLRFDKIV
jgi:hypothetical protein